MADLDFDKVKRNIQRMIDQNAPESDIDAYVSSEGTSPEELRAHTAMLQQPQTVNEAGKADPNGTISAGSYLTDMGGQFVKGIAEGIPGMVAGPLQGGIWAGKQLANLQQKYISGMSDDEIAANNAAGDKALADNHSLQAVLTAPQKAGEMTGVGTAQTLPGQYAKTIGEFVPAAATGGEGLLAKGAAVVVPAVTSETAGQLTKGTPYEGYARLGGALLGGGIAAGTKAGAESAALDKLAISTPELQAGKNAAYQLAEKVGQQQIPAQDYGDLVGKMNVSAPKGGAFAATTGSQISRSSAALDDMTQVLKDVQAGNRPPPTFNDLEEMRQSLNNIKFENTNIQGQLNRDGLMAKNLIGHIDDFTDTYAGAQDAFKTLRKTQDLDYAIKLADQSDNPAQVLQTQFKRIARENVGSNRYTPSEMNLINSVANGSFKGNLPTMLSKLGIGADYIAGQLGRAMGGLGGEAGAMLASNLTRQGLRSAGRSIDNSAAQTAALKARNLVSVGNDPSINNALATATRNLAVRRGVNALTAYSAVNDKGLSPFQAPGVGNALSQLMYRLQNGGFPALSSP